jgi:hypothetical protein
MMRLHTLLLFAALFGATPICLAAEEAPRGACRADVEKLCQGVERGKGAVARCLKEHEASLSSECKEAIARSREKARALGKACKEDAQQFCKDVNPGRGRIVRCLQQNADKVSQVCRAALLETRNAEHK